MVDTLLIVPHPDDEVFSCGGLFVRLADAGRSTALMTLTRGGAGRNLGLCAQEDLPARRERELRASCDALGIGELVLLDHEDYVTESGRGLEPRPGLAAVDPDELAERIRAEIDRLRPRVVITFPSNGSNGHPDHVACSLRVGEALARASHAPEALYWFAGDRPYAGPERPGFLPPDAIVGDFRPATHVLELDGRELEAKLRAMAMHESQALSVLMFMRNLTRRLRYETFFRAEPAAPEGGLRTVRLL